MARPRDHRVRVRWSALPEKPFCSRDTLLIVDGREMIVDRRSRLDGELTQPCAAGTCRAPNHAQPNRRSKCEELYQFGSSATAGDLARIGPSTICNQPATFFTSEGGSTHNIHVARMIRTVKEGEISPWHTQ
jgi:hypothetical protein